ncbi:50S ribosomal protein L1 [Candidatus Micrarchaeota archaeon]|nr:50S ribosomal protein L1 [Candidatus Micrarchaeota archaeon]
MKMILDKKSVGKAVQLVLSEKGKRKFVQSIDLAINLRDLDFTKPENRISLDVVLPHPARNLKVAVFADGNIAFEAKKHVDLVIESGQIESYVTDKAKTKLLLGHTLLATPALMAVVGKVLGKILAPKGKMPRPLLPNANIVQVADLSKKSITLKTKGKYLPTIHCIVGKESMSEEQVTENVLAVFEALLKKIAEGQLESVYLKTTMGKSVKV